MPKDAQGVFNEPQKADRVAWAKAGLDAYCQAVDGVPFEGYDHGEPGTAIKDFLADLMHLVGNQEQFFDWLDSAVDRYREEVVEYVTMKEA